MDTDLRLAGFSCSCFRPSPSDPSVFPGFSGCRSRVGVRTETSPWWGGAVACLARAQAPHALFRPLCLRSRGSLRREVAVSTRLKPADGPAPGSVGKATETGKRQTGLPPTEPTAPKRVGEPFLPGAGPHAESTTERLRIGSYGLHHPQFGSVGLGSPGTEEVATAGLGFHGRVRPQGV